MPFATTPDEVRAVTAAAIAEADRHIAVAPAGFADHALQAIDDAFDAHAIAYGEGAFLASVATDPALRDAGQEAEEQLATWRVELPFRDDLAAALTALGASPAAGALGGVEALYRREILEPGGSRDAIDLLRGFLGRDPSPATFLRLLGIEPAES